MFKKITCMTIALGLCLLVTSSALATGRETINEIDEVDAILASLMYLDSVEIFPSQSSIEVVPLYNVDGNKVAYYVSFSGTSYAVINNNKENPTPIEFGEGDSERIREKLNHSSTTKIIYSGPLNVWDFKEIKMSKNLSDKIPNLYETYPDLGEENPTSASVHNDLRSTYEERKSKVVMNRGDGDYGFVSAPVGLLKSSYTIKSATQVSGYWAKMSDYKNVSNHCGATAVTNLALYFAQRGHSKLKVTNTDKTFEAVYKVVGSTPAGTPTIANKAVKYFSDKGYKLNYSTQTGHIIAETKKALDLDRPLGILLRDALLAWHWVVGIGYRSYSSGDYYLRVITGWEKTSDKYYKPGSGSTLHSWTQYWVG